jgi:prolipoprotein diacylglyceryltransferase
LFRIYLFGYATFRFGLEFIRADSPFPAMGGPKPIQILLAITMARYAVLLWRREIRPATASAT